MKKTILIPTDLSIESLLILKSVLKKDSKDQQYDIILLAGFHLNDSITDLLFFSKDKFIKSVISDDFKEACNLIKNKYESKINSFRKDIFTGSTQAAFDNYIEANRIEEIYLLEGYQLKLKKNNFDLMPFVKKSKANLNHVTLNTKSTMPAQGKVAEIFFEQFA